jgi:hypothetical protein
MRIDRGRDLNENKVAAREEQGRRRDDRSPMKGEFGAERRWRKLNAKVANVSDGGGRW